MTRDLLLTILGTISDLKPKGNKYQAPKGKNLTFYLDAPAPGLTVNGIDTVTVNDQHVELLTQERTYYVPFEQVHTIAASEPRSRAGFE